MNITELTIAADGFTLTDPNKTTYTDKLNILTPIYMLHTTVRGVITGLSAEAHPHIYHPDQIDALLEALREFDNEELNTWLVLNLGEVIKEHLKKDM